MAQDLIVLLDENTANRIAAGEVVERPASAVKELVENSIDAGATQVVVVLDEGGKRKLSVTDNGAGMTRSDAIMALQRHATSKIRSADDLFAIQTLGFRGEALPSIASVCRFRIVTKPSDEDAGTQLRVAGGDIQDVEEVAAQNGTHIEAADLFYNTPARLKFLKSTPSEVSRSIEALGQLAIAYPGVSIRLYQGEQMSFSSPGTGQSLAAMAAVWGREVARKLIPIDHQSPGLSVSGYIATPELTRPGRSHELFFVNHRPIRSRLIGHALEAAFRSLTPESRYPIAAIFIEVNPDMVDVNVHPTKTEVKFTRDGEVHHAVSQAVKSALLAYGIVPTARFDEAVHQHTTTTTTTTMPVHEIDVQQKLDVSPQYSAYDVSDSFTLRAFATTTTTATNPDRQVMPVVDVVDQRVTEPFQSDVDVNPRGARTSGGSDPVDPFADTETDLVEKRPPRPFAERLREFRVLGQAQNTYIIALTPDGIAVIDQHVAHERVLYERLTVKRFALGVPTQGLTMPLTINLGRREALLLSEHCSSFAASGWEISPFGGESFVVRSVPAVLADKPYEQILRDMVDDLVNNSVSRRLLVQQDHVTITNACKMAVKAGDPLTIAEMTALLDQLADTENPYLCPHGRPIVVTMPYRDIDKMFKRT